MSSRRQIEREKYLKVKKKDSREEIEITAAK